MHPTVKPVALIADTQCDCSRRGDLVLDIFVEYGGIRSIWPAEVHLKSLAPDSLRHNRIGRGAELQAI
jgi:hypothetical protein